ncbi:hypothetical protein ACEQ77_000741 [Vibrio harveyi]|uniref:hypothetical protein n=1 Tax=Vibrio harveyi TaxID=669 RepID=UPI0024811C55|nr:hypothetical protein [Vibrio harveyi]HDM8173129.1 hypothetical protein [Vibrio harveyi]
MTHLAKYFQPTEYKIENDIMSLFCNSIFDPVTLKLTEGGYKIEYMISRLFFIFIANSICSIIFFLLDGKFFYFSALVFLLITVLSGIRMIMYEVRVCFVRWILSSES